MPRGGMLRPGTGGPDRCSLANAFEELSRSNLRRAEDIQYGTMEKRRGIMVLAILALTVACCATAGKTTPAAYSKDPQLVLHRTWHWVGTVTPVDTITVPHPERYTIRLADEGNVQARFDCNAGGGKYILSEGKLSFGPLLSTRMACPADSLDGPFLRDLQRTASFFVRDGDLYLELPYDSGTMRFRQAP